MTAELVNQEQVQQKSQRTKEQDLPPKEEKKQSAQPPQEAKTAEQNNTQEDKSKQEAESPKDINWKAFKAAREAERKQAEEIAKQAKRSQEEAAALKAALDAALNKSVPVQGYSEEQEESEESLIEKKVAQALAKKEAEWRKNREEEELKALPQRIAKDFKDFDDVCSADNLDYLDYHYPEISHALDKLPQSYEKWASIYRTVKKLIPNVDAKKEAAKAEKNLQKPQSSSSPAASHSGDGASPFRLDEKRKEENWRRMQRVINKLD